MRRVIRLFTTGLKQPVFCFNNMITKIIYTTDKRTNKTFVPDWVGKIMDIKSEKTMAEYNANLDYLKILQPGRSAYIWKSEKGILKHIVVNN
jgi:hypothetical protein